MSKEKKKSKEKAKLENKKNAGLVLMRKPFAPNQIGKLPKPTKKQTEEVKKSYRAGVRCSECNQWHHPEVVHLDYVGHAALTDRLLDCDPGWDWEPMAYDETGLPLFDKTGGLWIYLTVCGMTRKGYGHASTASFKDVGSREKELIGDALRNAAMRFGAALDLWHKGDLHKDPEKPKEPEKILTIAEIRKLLAGTEIIQTDDFLGFLHNKKGFTRESIDAMDDGQTKWLYDGLDELILEYKAWKK